MSAIQCLKCGAQYDRAQIGDLTKFQCGACSQMVNVPPAPPPPVARPVQPAQPQKRALPPAKPQTGAARGGSRSATRAAAAAEPQERGRGRGRREAAPESAKSEGPNKPLLFGVIGIVVIGVIIFALNSGGDAPPSHSDGDVAAVPIGDGAQPVETATAEITVSDWKSMKPAERKLARLEKVSSVNPADEADVRAAVQFFKDRSDEETVELLARRHLEKVPTSDFAKKLLGVRNMRSEIEAVLRASEYADDQDAAPFVKLRDLLAERAPGRRPFEPAPDEVADIEKLMAEVTAADKRLRDPYYSGARHWIRYQRAIEVMEDYPAVNKLVGPYLIFAQLDVKPGTPMSEAPPEKIAAAQKTLEANVKVFEALYEGWMTHIAPLLNMERYGPENATKDTLMKANIFPNRNAFLRYNAQVGGATGGVRAYYSLQEPRFICTYVGGKDEKIEEANQVQCHEATHQLVHFYTWDLSNKAGRKLNWLDCRTRALWSIEGFAEFFSSHTVKDGKYTWMQPLDERMRQIKIFNEIIEMKDWAPWGLRDILRPIHGGQLRMAGEARGKKSEDRGIAINVFSNQFYAKAWSLVHFLWYAEENGKPKYRDRLAAFMKREFYAELEPHGKVHKMTSGDFRRGFDLVDDAAFDQFERDWLAYEAALVKKHEKPSWATHRLKIFKLYKLDPNWK
jgi:hypothetical protein